MRLRSLGMTLVLLGLVATSLVAIRAADDKAKAKTAEKAGEEILPGPGEIKFSTAPAAVQKTFKDETKDAKIQLLGKGKPDEKAGDDKAIYRAIVGIGENNYDIIVAANGQVASKILQPITVEVKLEECPPAVQKAFQLEAKGAKVEVINKVSAGKRSDFIMDVVIQKSAYQLSFADDGTLMSKILDDGSDAEETGTPGPKGTEKKDGDKPGKKK